MSGSTAAPTSFKAEKGIIHFFGDSTDSDFATGDAANKDTVEFAALKPELRFNGTGTKIRSNYSRVLKLQSAGNVSVGGATESYSTADKLILSGLSECVDDDDAATKKYVDDQTGLAARGLTHKTAVKYAFTIEENVSASDFAGCISGGIVDENLMHIYEDRPDTDLHAAATNQINATVTGLADGDRVLILGETSSTNGTTVGGKDTANLKTGVYVVTTVSGNTGFARADDMDSTHNIDAFSVFVKQGIHADIGFAQVEDHTATVGTAGSPMKFTQFTSTGAAANLVFGNGITKSGNDVDLDNTIVLGTAQTTVGKITYNSTTAGRETIITGDGITLNGDTTIVAPTVTVSDNIDGAAAINLTSVSASSVAGEFSAKTLVTTDQTLGVNVPAITVPNGAVSLAAGNLVLAGGKFAITNGSGAANACTISEDLTVSGDVSALTFAASSDRKLKQNISYTTPASDLANILSIKPATYQFKSAPEDDRRGVIAQDLQLVAPELVKTVHTGSSAEHLVVNYVDLISTLVGAVQALQQKVDALQ